MAKEEIAFGKSLINEVQSMFKEQGCEDNFFICSYDKRDISKLKLRICGERDNTVKAVKLLNIGFSIQENEAQMNPRVIEVEKTIEALNNLKSKLKDAPDELLENDILLDVGLHLNDAIRHANTTLGLLSSEDFILKDFQYDEEQA